VATLGYVLKDAVAKFFAAIDPTPNDDGTPSTAPRAPYVVLPIDSPQLERDNQFAVYRDGRVERAFWVWDTVNPVAKLDEEGRATGELVPQTMSESEAIAAGIDVSRVGDRDSAVRIGGYLVQNVRRPQVGNGGGWDRVLGTVVTVAFQAIASIILAPVGGAYALAAAQAATGERIGDANAPVRYGTPALEVGGLRGGRPGGDLPGVGDAVVNLAPERRVTGAGSALPPSGAGSRLNASKARLWLAAGGAAALLGLVFSVAHATHSKGHA
jgi:hypothetical protein